MSIPPYWQHWTARRLMGAGLMLIFLPICWFAANWFGARLDRPKVTVAVSARACGWNDKEQAYVATATLVSPIRIERVRPTMSFIIPFDKAGRAYRVRLKPIELPANTAVKLQARLDSKLKPGLSCDASVIFLDNRFIQAGIHY